MREGQVANLKGMCARGEDKFEARNERGKETRKEELYS